MADPPRRMSNRTRHSLNRERDNELTEHYGGHGGGNHRGQGADQGVHRLSTNKEVLRADHEGTYISRYNSPRRETFDATAVLYYRR